MNNDFRDILELLIEHGAEFLVVAFGAPLQAHGVGPAELSVEGKFYRLGLPPRRIDILTQIDGVDFEDAWRGRIELLADGMKLPFLGLAELMTNKRATAPKTWLILPF